MATREVQVIRLLAPLLLVLAACAPSTDPATAPTQAAAGPAATSTTTGSPSSSTTVAEADAAPIPGAWFLVSVTAELPDGLSAGLASIDGVEAVSTVGVGLVHVVATRSSGGSLVDEAPSGYVIPLEAQAFDVVDHSEYVPDDVARLLRSLGRGDVLLSESSAAFRRLGTGATLLLDDGTELEVVGVVADEWIGAAEVAVTRATGTDLGVTRERYSVVRFVDPRALLDRGANALVDAKVRVRSRNEVDVFRHADAVASQIEIKEHFGEFAYRPVRDDVIEIDPVWVAAHIVRGEVPLLGTVTCHVDYLPLLRAAMTTLEERGEGDVIDRGAFRGCFKPRYIRNRKDLSRHAWGVAADINFGNPIDGSTSPAHPALVAAALGEGILSGHTWTDPGPGHFEWYATSP